MKIPFYILGLLIRYGPQHGYRLKQIIEERISDFAKIKLPTIYYHLERLKEKGYVTESVDRDGNRPEKTIYCITESGREYFYGLFQMQTEESYSPEFPLDGVLYFSEEADSTELLLALQSRLQELVQKIEALNLHEEAAMKNIGSDGVFCAKTIFEHHRCHLEAERNWLTQTIEGLSR